MAKVVKCNQCGGLFESQDFEHVCEPDQKARLYNLWYLQVEHDARRDEFAAAALMGLLAVPGDDELPIEPNAGETVVQYLARVAVDYADAILAELDKPQE